MVKEGFGVAGNDISIGADIITRTALDEEFSNASGLYFDNDNHRLSAPHSEAANPEKVKSIMAAITSILKKVSN